ncbi:hypothetical protein [Stenotrophomonas maltophilia]|uniref:hypothetical protein n=1 Tax=Stenotrophomonas maltophilia TaxID=40324 RepID=UPI0039E16ADB
MSNDKTTLADVQPGGRVRLGTPGARWAAIGEPDPHGTRYDCERAALVMGDLTDDELANAVFMHGNERQTMAELIGGATPAIAYLTAAKDRIRWLSRALAAAESLSAQPSPATCKEGLQVQPSPGGQDAHEMADALERIASGSLSDYEGVDADELHILRCAKLIRDLSSRQPVGEPIGWYTEDHLTDRSATTYDRAVADRWRAKGWPVSPLYAAPPAQQPAQVYLDGLDRALGEAIDQRDRYHEVADDLAGHIAAITGVDIGEHSSANCPWQNAIEAAEEYKPAQAVDLPYSLDADPAGIRARVADVITGTLMVGAQGHTPPPVGHWAEPFWQAARADAKAQAVDLVQDDSEALLHIKTAPKPVSQPSEEWVEQYVQWHDEGRRVMRRADRG